MSNLPRIGFIGIGNMGAPMAGNLVRAGYRVMVYDIAAERAKQFAQQHNAGAASSPTELAQNADLVISMLPSGREVRQVFLEMEGGALAANLRKGSVAVDMSSADPIGTRQLGEALASRGVALVDAPVSGGVPGAKDGSLTIMIGGDSRHVGAVKPVLACLGKRLFEVGGPGCGHAMKALNNFLAGTSFAAASEALRVGRQFGLDPAVMIDVINVSTGRSFPTDMVMKQHVLSGSFATGFALGLLAKDLKIASDLAAQLGAEAPVGRLICELWAGARDGLGGEADHSRAAIYWDRSAVTR
jgi:3-hydroxyisobutyrate dehydrogenase